MSSTHDTDTLAEKITTEIEWHIYTAFYRGYAKANGTEMPDSLIGHQIESAAHAIRVAVAAEVRKAKAEAWEECASEIEMQGAVQIPDKPLRGAEMNSLKDHWIDDMGGWDADTSSPEFELWRTCGRTFTAQGSDRIESAIAVWGEHVQEEME
ncbi:hypothetical protein [Dermabacter vaginalis]|uniref:Uncharacterized protein n=1 Tax=Dermabacter vaginalis TaxID=1630135 RepID=A0ABX6A370_9MICO|nr:hypothetical protein [Dermabacter vaginalis]QEU11631.1 hypothetical protein FOB48_04535 [Dermabacter vaginalis]